MLIISYGHRNKSPYTCHIRQSNFLLWNKFCHKENCFWDNWILFSPSSPPFLPTLWSNPRPLPPSTSLMSELFSFFFLFVSISQLANYSQTCLRWHRIKHSHCIRRHIPVGDCLIQGWLNWTNKFCPHFLHQTQIISIIVPIPPNFSPFPLVADCGVLLEIVDARMS